MWLDFLVCLLFVRKSSLAYVLLLAFVAFVCFRDGKRYVTVQFVGKERDKLFACVSVKNLTGWQ